MCGGLGDQSTRDVDATKRFYTCRNTSINLHLSTKLPPLHTHASIFDPQPFPFFPDLGSGVAGHSNGYSRRNIVGGLAHSVEQPAERGVLLGLCEATGPKIASQRDVGRCGRGLAVMDGNKIRRKGKTSLWWHLLLRIVGH